MKKKLIIIIILISSISAILYLSLKNEPWIISVDDQGIPLVDYGTLDGLYIGKQRNPVTISHSSSTSHDIF